MKTLIIHIGYPKTATTSLQLNFFSSLHKSGKIEYLNHLNEKNDYLGNIYCRKILKYIMGMPNDINIDEELENLKNISRSISVISNENISFFHDNFSWAYNNSEAVNNIKRIKETLSPFFEKIEILIFIRAQVTMLPSFYAQQYNHIKKEAPKFEHIKNWLQHNIFENKMQEKLFLNYNYVYDSYCKLFGEKNVNIFLFEDLNNKNKRICNKLATILNIDESYIYKLLKDNKKRNATLQANSGQIIASSSSLMDSMTYLYNKYFFILVNRGLANKFNLFLKKNIPKKLLNKKFKNQIEPISDFEKTKILDVYRESNLILLKKLDISYKEFKLYKYI